MENGPEMKMYFLLNMGIFHCYVSLPERKFNGTLQYIAQKNLLLGDVGKSR